MRVFFGFVMLCVAFASLAAADHIYLKSGTVLTGQVLTIGSDSVTIRTLTNDLKIALIDIQKIETLEPEKDTTTTEKPATVSRSMKQVGYGCLGGIIGGALATMITVYSDGFDDGKVAVTVICGSVIIGILLGSQAGKGCY